MSKTCVKLVRRQWADGGVVIHLSPTSLWNEVWAGAVSTGSSPASSPRRTQIVHSHVDDIYRFSAELSAVSTQPITTTTT
jgi:hypothetical protein